MGMAFRSGSDSSRSGLTCTSHGVSLRASFAAAATLIAFNLAGCAAPARPSAAGLAATGLTPTSAAATTEGDSSFFADPSAATSRSPAPTPTPIAPWDGTYIVTLHTKWFGPVHARMDASPAGELGFKANTPPNVAWSLVGGIEGSVGQVLMPFLFPRGMIFTWNSSLPRLGPEGTPIAGEGSIGVGTLDRLRIKTRIAEPGAPAELIFKEDRVMGTLTVEPLRDAHARSTDYPRLAEQIRQKMPAMLYDPAIASDPKLAAFFDDLANGADRARDDLEFMFAGAAAARKNIEFQMPLIFPEGPPPDSIDKLTPAARTDNAYKIGPDNELENVAVVRFDAFLDTTQVDEAMRLALNTHAAPRAGLILDLRTSTGVDLAAFRAAQWLVSEPIEAGAYLGAPRRNSGAPLPHVDLRTHSDYQVLADRLEREGGVDITVWPIELSPFSGPTFTGPVAVVTSERTSSTSEALVATLKRAGRVRVVGQPTAGRPLLSSEISLGQGWILRVARYDLLAPAGADPGLKDNRGVKNAPAVRQDDAGVARSWQRSVAPDVKSSSDGVDEARKEMRAMLNARNK